MSVLESPMRGQGQSIENDHRQQSDSREIEHVTLPETAALPSRDSKKVGKSSKKDEGGHDFRDAREANSDKKLDKWQASLIYITNQVGIGILGLLAALQTLGLIPGIVCIIGLGVTVMYTAYVLLQFFRRYPSVLSCVDCFRIIGGTPLATIVGLGFVLNQLFACSSAVITMSIALNSISEHAICTILFILVPTIVSCILCMPRRMKFLADFGIPCTISILAATIIVMIALGVAGPNGTPPGWEKDIVLVGHPSFAQGFTSVLNIAFAYAGNQAFVTVMAEMEDPSRDFMPSIFILQGFAIPMYTIVGAVVYVLAGEYTTSPALGAAPMVTAKIAYGLLIPTLLGTSLVFGHTSIKYMFIEGLRMMDREYEYTQSSRRTWIMWLGIGGAFWTLVFLLANAIPLFHSILSVSAALFVSWFTFGMSGVMWLYLNWDAQFCDWKKTCLAILNWTIIALTLFANGVGLWASIQQLTAAYNDPLVPVDGSFTCADNSVWGQLGIDL